MKRWHWILIGASGVVILGFAVVIYALTTPPPPGYTIYTVARLIFDFLDKWASAGAPAMTLLAVAVALYMGIKSLRQTEKIQKQERKERLLNEIIEWLKELEGHVFTSSDLRIGEPTKRIIDIMSKPYNVISLEEWQFIDRVDSMLAGLNSLKSEIREGEYKQKIALELDKGLGSLIKIVLEDLKKRPQLIDRDFGHPPNYKALNTRLRDSFPEGIKEGEELDARLIEDLYDLFPEEGKELRRNDDAIMKSVANAIDKAIEIKTSFLQ